MAKSCGTALKRILQGVAYKPSSQKCAKYADAHVGSPTKSRIAFAVAGLVALTVFGCSAPSEPSTGTGPVQPKPEELCAVQLSEEAYTLLSDVQYSTRRKALDKLVESKALVETSKVRASLEKVKQIEDRIAMLDKQAQAALGRLESAQAKQTGKVDVESVKEYDSQLKGLKIQASKQRRARAGELQNFSYGLIDSWRYIKDKKISVLLLEKKPSIDGVVQIVEPSSAAAQAVLSILKDELSWKRAAADADVYDEGYDVSLAASYSNSSPQVSILLGATKPFGGILSGEYAATRKLDVPGVGLMDIKIKAMIPTTSGAFAGYPRNLIDDPSIDDGSWIISNKFAFDKYNLVHEVCHVLGMVHELQQPSSDKFKLNDYATAKKNLLLDIDSRWDELKYNDYVLKEYSRCRNITNAGGNHSLPVCRGTTFDLLSVMAYWIPVSIDSGVVCKKESSGNVCYQGSAKLKSLFIGWNSGSIPPRHAWLTVRDRSFLVGSN